MGNKNRYFTIKNNDGKITLEFDTMFYVTAARRETPPPTRVQMPKKGRGSYDRKEKHKGRCHYDNDDISFLFIK